MGSLMGVRRRILNNSPHIESASGNMASFKTDIVSALKECKVHFNAIQEGSGDPSPTNIRPISGRTGLTLTHAGTNLLQCDTFANGTYNGVTFTGTRNASGEIESISVTGKTTAVNTFRNLNYLNKTAQRFPPDGRYATFGYVDDVDIILGTSRKGIPKDINGVSSRNYLGRTWRYFDIVNDNSNGAEWFRLQTVPYSPSGINYNSIVHPMVCINEDAECDFEPYKGVEIPISWQSQLGTLYGGYVDLVSGELVQTHKKLTLNGNENWYMSTSTNPDAPYIPNIAISDAKRGEYIAGISDKLTGTTNYQPPLYHVCINNNGRIVIGVPASMSTREAVNAWIQELGGIDIVYPIETPIVYQLSPQTIKTLKGRNNIWCDNETYMEVEYWTH